MKPRLRISPSSVMVKLSRYSLASSGRLRVGSLRNDRYSPISSSGSAHLMSSKRSSEVSGSAMVIVERDEIISGTLLIGKFFSCSGFRNWNSFGLLYSPSFLGGQ